MPFLEEVIFHAFYPYDNLENFNYYSSYEWQNVSRYLDTDVSYENGVFKGAKLHTEAGGKAYYYGMNGPSYLSGLRFVHS